MAKWCNCSRIHPEVKKREKYRCSLIKRSAMTINQQPSLLTVPDSTVQHCLDLDLLHFYYQNVRGLRTKTKDFFLASSSCDYNVIAITESWLNPSFHDAELFNCNYVVYRCDRSPLNSEFERGGGVLIAVRSSPSYASERIIVPGTENVEILFVKLFSRGKTIFLCCLYIPSGSSDEIYRRYHDVLTLFLGFVGINCSDTFLIFGDFNLPNIEWCRESDGHNFLLPTNVKSGIQEDLITYLLGSDLSQLSGVRNRRGRLLDLLFSNAVDQVTVAECEYPLVPVDVDHIPFEGTLDITTVNQSQNNVFPFETNFIFKRANFNQISEYLSSIDWTHHLRLCDDVDGAVDFLYSKLSYCFHHFVPRRRVPHSSHPPWYDRSVLQLKNLKTKSYKRYKKSKLRSDYTAYSRLRGAFKSCQQKAYNTYLRRTEQSLKRDPSKFWSFVASKRKTSGFPGVMFYGDLTATSEIGICELFASFFKKIYVADKHRTDSGNGSVPLMEGVDLGSLQLSRSDVLRALVGLNIKKGRGPDEIPPIVLKNCAESLVTPLLYIFNLSLSLGNFPKCWKVSYITPIFKSASRSNVENYRGVAILPTIGKLFEKVVCDWLAEKLKHHICVSQHGFVRGRSVSSNLIEFTNYASGVIESGSQLDVIYTDFSKAFDRVPHTLLLRKLHMIGVHSSLLSWISSYLVGRWQYVRLCGCRSSTFEVHSGVPQGSHLGPLLFLLYVNDIPTIFKSRSLLYADDLKLFRRIVSVADAQILQQDLLALSDWCSRNGLNLNIGKCKCLTFHRKRGQPMFFDYTIDGTILVRIEETFDLGILFDNKLSFTKHIEHSIAKAYSMLGFITRICSDFTDPLVLKCLYFAHVRTYLEYAVTVWCPYFEVYINRIESIQKRFIWLVFCKFGWQEYIRCAPYSFKCNLLGLQSLQSRRLSICCMFVFDILSNRMDVPNLLSLLNLNVPCRVFRQQRVLRLQYHRTDYGASEPIHNLSSIFNQCNNLFDFGMSRNIFEKRIRAYIGNNMVVRCDSVIL